VTLGSLGSGGFVVRRRTDSFFERPNNWESSAHGHPFGSNRRLRPNVTLTATDTGTHQARKVKTESTEFTNVRLLAPGSGRVKFEASGFQAMEVPSFVTETTILDRELEWLPPLRKSQWQLKSKRSDHQFNAGNGDQHSSSR
jgi:hypothetical protein